MNGSVCSLNGSISPESFRQYLLYWDKIELPQNNIINTGEDELPEVKFLTQEGILTRTLVSYNGFSGNIGNVFIQSQHTVLTELNQQAPGCWSIAQSAKEIYIPGQTETNNRRLEVELYSALPVPVPEVPLEEILRFKEDRNAELIAFRGTMDGVYEQVLSSSDIPRAKIKAIADLEKSLSDLNKVFTEKWYDRFISTLKVEINIPNLVAGGFLGMAAGSQFGIDASISSAIGAASTALKFDLGLGRREIPKNLREYAYLHSITSRLS